MGDLVTTAWRQYLKSLRERPLATKAITSGILGGVSDLIAQKISGAKHVQLRKMALMALLGLLYGGPSAHFTHKLLDSIFHKAQDVKTVVKKVILEQLTYGPLCNIVFMSYISAIVEGHSWSFVKERLRRDYPSVQLNGWKVWPLAALINYKFIPIQFRVLFVNLVAIFWSTFLILQARSSKQKLKAQ